VVDSFAVSVSNEHSTLLLDLSGYADLDNDPANPSTFTYSWFVNGFEIGRTTRNLASEYFAKGDQLHCVVTPYDGSAFGDEAVSGTVTILNTPPTIIDATLDHTGPRPDKNSILSIDMSGFEDLDGDLPDLRDFAYEWFVNDISVGTDSTLALAPYAMGDDVYCMVTPSDGTSHGSPIQSESTAILNTPPSFVRADIDITYDGSTILEANLSSVLIASGNTYSDPDNDTEQAARYSWYINDEFSKSGNTIDGLYFQKEDRVYCMVEPYDGTYYGTPVKTDEIIITNTAPEVGEIRIYAVGNNPTRVATFAAEIIDFYDKDDDPQDVHAYVWYVNGTEVIGQDTSTFKNNYSMEIPYFTKGDAISVMVTPSDGTDHGSPVLSSNEIIIVNTAPVLSDAEIQWTGDLNATTILSVNALEFYSDPDGDPHVNFYYEWWVNSELIVTKFNDNTLSGLFVSGDMLVCEVTPNDGEDNGTKAPTSNIVIQDSPPEIYGTANLVSDSYPANEDSTISVNTEDLRTVDIDGDSTTLVFKWYVNGNPAHALEVNALKGIYFDKGDLVTCRIYAYDGTMVSLKHIVSSGLAVGNTAPTAIIVRPYDNTYGTVHEPLRLDGTDSFDPDASDTNSLSYKWLVDGKEETGEIADILLSPGDHVVTLEVSDGNLNDTATANVHIRASDLMITEDRITISGVQYVDKSISFVVNIGVTNPAKDIIEIAHDHGAIVLLDGCQSTPHQPVDVRDLDADFLAMSIHKMMGPTGMGVLYGKYDLLERLDPCFGGGDTVQQTSYAESTFLAPPERYEAGLQNYAGVIGTGAAIDYITTMGLSEIHDHEHTLNRAATKGLLDMSAQIIGPEDASLRSGILSFNLPGIDPHDISMFLDDVSNVMIRSGMHCVHSWFTARELKGSARASFYLYNTLDEVKVFLETVEQIRDMLG